MQIALLTPDDHRSYEAFLKERPCNLLYASLKYRSFLEELLGCRSEYYVATSDGRIRGALPLMFCEGSLGRVVNSLPYYGSNGGIMSACPQAAAALLARYNEIVAAEHVAAANLVANPLDQVDYGSIAHDVLDSRIGQFTPLDELSGGADDLPAAFHYKTRNMIRKAQKSAIAVSVDNDAIDFVRQVHVENMVAIGGLAKSDRFFTLIDKHFQKGSDYRIYVAHLAGEPIAAALLFYFNRTVEYFTPVIKEAQRSLQPLSLIIWEAMRAAASEGYVWWNWGGTWKSQEGVYRFKSRWNTRDIEYTYYNKINHAGLYVTPRERLMADYANFFTLPFSLLKKCA